MNRLEDDLEDDLEDEEALRYNYEWIDEVIQTITNLVDKDKIDSVMNAASKIALKAYNLGVASEDPDWMFSTLCGFKN